ncbi:hypothetical protein [Mesorhizobium sp.]|uniref:hypothetical protein n=2 Tax=Mesorhizobium sp. TaxID=1871066 RepID=UPI000FE78414|nr:hypothetical protein [Mesorhizobium sp.]RWK58609.1 MAG: hypothetical protein EOR49_30425 [Mesorhizobium sp.]RWM44516.1 MAG: hypothetical protein EOR76_24310 [Mesorhizobium sp.]RWM46160.1 MAG: hypothetical protein EOR78_33050 [Mesorhizobium sp.]RWM48218.1 MAG: hypothetical protein EOR79_32905 [Mesorhizobium sp.]RWM89551.1 MAG: hypothetical protein EOR85_32495 [Mesorhizobium sp.]
MAMPPIVSVQIEQNGNKSAKCELTPRGMPSYLSVGGAVAHKMGRAAMGRRKSRFDRLSTRYAEAIIRDALSLRKTVLSSQLHLKAHSELFWQLCGLVEKLHEVMASVAEKEPDFRIPDLGLLPLPEDYLTRK